MHIHGIIPPVATPMQANEDLDLPRLRWFLDHLIGHGVHGVFVLGTNSEFYALDEREKQEVIATTVAHVNKRVPVYAGTGAETTREVVRLTQHGRARGGRRRFRHHAILHQPDAAGDLRPLPPHRREHGPAGRAVQQPWHLRRRQDRRGHRRPPGARSRTSWAIKDSSGDLQNTNEIIRVVPERFSVLMGRDTLIFPALLFGARGAVPATGNVAPALLAEIYDAFQRGDLEASKAAQLRLNPLRLALTLCTQPGAVKAALQMLGLPIGPCRSPVAGLAPDKVPKMKAALQAAGLLS